MSELLSASYAILAHGLSLLSSKHSEYLSPQIIAPKAVALWIAMVLWYFFLSCFSMHTLVTAIEPVVPDIVWKSVFASEFDNLLHISLTTSLPERVYTTVLLASSAYVRSLPSLLGAFLVFVFLRAAKDVSIAYLPPSVTDKALSLFDTSPSHPPPLERIHNAVIDECAENRLAVDEDFGVLPETILLRWRHCDRERETLLSQLRVASRRPLPPVRNLLVRGMRSASDEFSEAAI